MGEAVAAAGVAFDRVVKDQAIAANPDPAPKVARLAEILDRPEADLRAALPENRLVEMFNTASSAYRRSVNALFITTMATLPALIATGAMLDKGHKTGFLPIVAWVLAGVASSIYPYVANRRLKKEIDNSASLKPQI